MSEYRQIIAVLEIEAYSTAYATRSGFPLSDLDWATTISTGVVESFIPQNFTVDIISRAISNGGASLLIRDAYELLNVLPSTSTFITADVSTTDTTINVDDTTPFAASGNIFILVIAALNRYCR